MSEKAASDSGSGGSQAEDQLVGGGSGGSGDNATQARGAAAQQESPPFVGIVRTGGAVHRWRAAVGMEHKCCWFPSRGSRAEAAAGRDLAVIWRRVHSKGGRQRNRAWQTLAPSSHARGLCLTYCSPNTCFFAEDKRHPVIFNFPQLLGDEQLRERLHGAADIAALKAVVADWLQQQWPLQGAALLAGRQEALAR